MKKQIFALLLLPAFCFAAISPVLTLTETNGVSTTGKIISYSPQTGSTRIQTGEAIIQRAISAFNLESQEKINHWLADKHFRSKAKLRGNFRLVYHTSSSTNIVGTITDSRANTTREGTIGTEERNFSKYKVSLENRSNTAFEDLTISYRIFYTHRLRKDLMGQYQLAGTATCESIAPGSTYSFETTPFMKSVVYTSAFRIRWGGRPPDTGDNVLGILLCIRKKGVGGEWIEQEIEHGEVPRKRDRSDYQKVYE